jgi:hypothetical protein
MISCFDQEILVAPPEYAKLRAAIVGLKPAPMLIGIDGKDGSGKSSCGAWLSWQLNLPCIHLDQYVKPNSEGWHVDHLRHAIESRVGVGSGWPVIVEGCLLLHALAQIERMPNYLVFVENSAYPLGSALQHERIDAYLKEAKPQKIADFSMRVQFEKPSARDR